MIQKLSKSGGGVSTIVSTGGDRSCVRTIAVQASWLLQQQEEITGVQQGSWFSMPWVSLEAQDTQGPVC